MINSAFLALGATAIALPVGTLLAVLVARCDLPGRRLAMALLGVLLFLPLYVQLSGWDAAFGKLGWFSLAYGSMAQPLLTGMRGAIVVHAAAAVPWVALLVSIGLWQASPTAEEAALLAAGPRAALGRITLPQARPLIAAAAIWTIVSTASDMTVTNIYLINPSEWTATERFYMTIGLGGSTGEATASALPAIVSLAGLSLTTVWMVAQLGRRRLLPGARQRVLFRLGSWRWLMAASAWLVILLLIGLPVASLIAKAGFVVVRHEGEVLRSWSARQCAVEIGLAPWRFRREYIDTIRVAALAATVALAVGMALAWPARRGGWRAVPAMAAIVLALAIPGPLVGVGLIGLLNHDVSPEIAWPTGTPKSWLLLLYDDTSLAPVVAQAIRALPLTGLVAWQCWATLDENVLAAAALDGLSPARVLRRVALPQRWRAIAAAWIMAFAVAAGDLAWAHLVTPPGLDLLQRRIFGLVHSGVEEQVAAISLVNILAYALLTAAVWGLLRIPARPFAH